MTGPILFHPHLVEKPWGGLIREGKVWGEAFLVSVIPGCETYSANDNRTLFSYINQNADYLLGHAVVDKYGRILPIYQKKLFAQENLSIQVHPDNALSQKLATGSMGKEEAWFITATTPNACIYIGFNQAISAPDLDHLLKTQQPIENYLNKIKVNPGEMYYIPARIVHAIGAGVTLIEPQQCSNTTFRVYDWNRVDDQGQARPLHLKESLATINFAPDQNQVANFKLQQKANRWVDGPYFSFDHYLLQDLPRPLSTQLAFQILHVLTGKGQLQYQGNVISLVADQTWFIPGGLGDYQLNAADGAEVLITTPSF